MNTKAFSGQLTTRIKLDKTGRKKEVEYVFEISQVVSGTTVLAKTITGTNKLNVEMEARDWLKTHQNPTQHVHGGTTQ